MMKLDDIRRRLRDRRMAVVAEATGIHRNTITAIVAGRIANPSYETIKALSDYLEGRTNVS